MWFFTNNVADQTLGSWNRKLPSTHCILLIWPTFKFSFVPVSNSTFQPSWTAFSDQNGFLLVIQLHTIPCHILIRQPAIFRVIIYRSCENHFQIPDCALILFITFLLANDSLFTSEANEQNYPLFNCTWHLVLILKPARTNATYPGAVNFYLAVNFQYEDRLRKQKWTRVTWILTE